MRSARPSTRRRSCSACPIPADRRSRPRPGAATPALSPAATAPRPARRRLLPLGTEDRAPPCGRGDRAALERRCRRSRGLLSGRGGRHRRRPLGQRHGDVRSWLGSQPLIPAKAGTQIFEGQPVAGLGPRFRGNERSASCARLRHRRRRRRQPGDPRRLADEAARHGFRLVAPPTQLCGDNAVMIAWAGAERLALGLIDRARCAGPAALAARRGAAPTLGAGSERSQA